VLYGISISLFLDNQLATYLPNYTDQRKKIPVSAFHGGCEGKKLLKTVAN